MNFASNLIYTFLISGIFSISGSISYGQKIPLKDYPIQPINFTKVKVNDHFWAPRIELNQKVTIPIAIAQCYKTGRIENFKIAGKLTQGKFQSEYPFDDSDVYKIIEGASYSIQTHPDKQLESRIDTIINYINLAQEPDGYLYTNRTIDSLHMHQWVGKKRWEKDPNGSHELYNIGHLYEAAYAHFLATGKRTLLNVAIKSADLVDHDFGVGKLSYYPGHQVIEMGLVKLYRVTGEERYLRLAKFFLDCRKGGNEYNQAHKPVIEQDQIVGHAVRATYMYAGMADVSALTGNKSYKMAIDKIWNDLLASKFYLTGGIGSAGTNEGFSDPYFLPNRTAYCETCASISNVFWNYRMFLLEGDAKYFDVLERTLYNALLSGISLSADRFFYTNPLESHGEHKRSAWFGCACCPSNICRFIPSVPGYVYAQNGDSLYVNLFMNNTATINLKGEPITIEQITEYPWKGKIAMNINPGKTGKFNLLIRIPGWAQNQALPTDIYSFKTTVEAKATISLNGTKSDYLLKKGYAVISREWKKGDQLVLELPMPVREIVANPKIKEDSGKVALQRGPLVYCVEWPDNKDGNVPNLLLNRENNYTTEYRPGLLNGVITIQTTGSNSKPTVNKIISDKDQIITAIPYYSWANRGAGEMSVWISEARDVYKTMPPEGGKYTIEDCINQFDMNQSTKTTAGYQYWFIAQNFLKDGLTVKMSVVGPKLATHDPHRHAGDEIYYVLEGTAQFYLDGKTATGGANTTFYCPENSEHGISNAGNQELKYLVIRKYPKKGK